MITPPIPANEAERLEALYALKVLDTPAEERFDRLTRLAIHTFRVPIAMVSLIDEGRQWVKSCQGLAGGEAPRSISFCGHAILREEATVVEDALLDERFWDNPTVVGEPRIRFYAGHPLHAPNGMKLGTLCLIDRVPRTLDEADLAALYDLASLVEEELSISRLVHAYQVAEENVEIQKELNRIKDHSLSMTSHELKNPLTAIRGFALLLQNNLAKGQRMVGDEGSGGGNNSYLLNDFDRTIWKVDTILRQANRMERLISDILDVSRIQKKDGFSLSLQPDTDLAPLINRLVEQQEQSWPDYTVTGVIEDERIVGTWDEERIEQVLVNLVNNAAKFSPTGSRIEIGARLSTHGKENAYGMVGWVRDEGCGIDERDQQHLFELFYQAKDPAIAKNEGLGLGLFISNQIILQHGGRMWIESQPGKGSTFYFFLPATN